MHARLTIAGLLAAACLVAPVMAAPANDLCASATATALNTPVAGTAAAATNDGSCSCSPENTPDVYHRFTTTVAGIYAASLCSGTAWDTVLSLHTGCPAVFDPLDPSLDTQVDCNDDGCDPNAIGVASVLRTYLPAATTYIVRIASYDSSVVPGPYSLTISAPPERLGACCALGACSPQTQAACLSAGGTFAGEWVSCQIGSGTTQTFASTGTPVAIPNGPTAGVSRSITVGPSFAIADVRVIVDVTHPFLTDLTLTLSKGAISVPLVQRVGLGTSPLGLDLSGQYTFSDAGSQTFWERAFTLPVSATAVPIGTYAASDGVGNPISLRAALAGSGSTGTWTLTITDLDPADAGTLNGWQLVFEPGTADRCAIPGACCTGAPQGGVGTTCTLATLSECAAAGGSFRGSGISCGAAGNPVACCKANFDAQSGVQVNDIFSFLSAWFSSDPRADFDGVNGRTIADIFAFLAAWFARCPG